MDDILKEIESIIDDAGKPKKYPEKFPDNPFLKHTQFDPFMGMIENEIKGLTRNISEVRVHQHSHQYYERIYEFNLRFIDGQTYGFSVAMDVAADPYRIRHEIVRRVMEAEEMYQERRARYDWRPYPVLNRDGILNGSMS